MSWKVSEFANNLYRVSRSSIWHKSLYIYPNVFSPPSLVIPYQKGGGKWGSCLWTPLLPTISSCTPVLNKKTLQSVYLASRCALYWVPRNMQLPPMPTTIKRLYLGCWEASRSPLRNERYLKWVISFCKNGPTYKKHSCLQISRFHRWMTCFWIMLCLATLYRFFLENMFVNPVQSHLLHDLKWCFHKSRRHKSTLVWVLIPT